MFELFYLASAWKQKIDYSLNKSYFYWFIVRYFFLNYFINNSNSSIVLRSVLILKSINYLIVSLIVLNKQSNDVTSALIVMFLLWFIRER